MFESDVKLAPCTTRIVPFETSRPPVVAETELEKTNSRDGSAVSQLMPTELYSLPLNTVLSRYRRAMKKLRVLLS